MTTRPFHLRTLLYFWRSHLAVAVGVAAGSAALTGALLVGDSIRGSLRELALGRLGHVDLVITSPRFIHQAAAALGPANGADVHALHPVIILQGAVTTTDHERTAPRVAVLGMDKDFAALAAPTDRIAFQTSGQGAIANQALADALGLRPGDEILLRIPKRGNIAAETPLGRRDDASATLRIPLTCVVANEGIGGFGLNPVQRSTPNVFVPLAALQRAVGQSGKFNALLIDSDHDQGVSFPEDWWGLPKGRIRMADLGLKLRIDEARRYLSLESEAFLLEPQVEKAALHALSSTQPPAQLILTHLANRLIRVKAETDITALNSDSGTAKAREFIPYSTVSAVSSGGPLDSPFSTKAVQPGEIILNEWAATQLLARIGDTIQLEYYVNDQGGALNTAKADFRLAGVVTMDATTADPGFTPEYPGVTDTENLADWDPPFPVHLDWVKQVDEDYWDQYRTAPKAFVSLDDGWRIWATQGKRFGRLTSIRLPIPQGINAQSAAGEFEEKLLAELSPESMGLRLDPIRDRLSQAASGSTDFGMLFVGFSFFLVAAAAMLVVLLFRLGVERRAPEIGLLLAVGFTPRTISRWMMVQGAWVACIGVLFGLFGALVYAGIMIHGLTTWWSAAVNMKHLKLHASGLSLAGGAICSAIVGVAAVALSVRGLTRLSPKDLLACNTENLSRRGSRFRVVGALAMTCLLGALALPILAAGGLLPATGSFFGAGTLAVAGLIAWFAWTLRPTATGAVIQAQSTLVSLRLGLRQASRKLGRSVLMVGLVASASFVIAAMEAMRMQAGTDVGRRDSGTGGFALIGEASVPILYDLNTPAGREKLNVGSEGQSVLADAAFFPFRLQPGDETSCLNLYRPGRPRILGAPATFIERGGFAFAGVLAGLPESTNPWTLLNGEFDDGAIPVIGDEAAVRWQLKSGLGEDWLVTNERGVETKLRFVALLRGSILQSELVVSEARFQELYPSVSGYGFHLIEAPAGKERVVRDTLARELADFGYLATSSVARLNEYLAVQNTYLGTFQSLGGLGLALGTVGLAAVVLRNTWERRAEMGLMRAVGFPKRQWAWLLFVEHAALVTFGLVAGLLAALLAIAPQVADQPDHINWRNLTLTLLTVLVSGLVSTLAAVLSSVRAPVMAALRRE